MSAAWHKQYVEQHVNRSEQKQKKRKIKSSIKDAEEDKKQKDVLALPEPDVQTTELRHKYKSEFCIVTVDEATLPGQILDVTDEGMLCVSLLTPSGADWKWPKEEHVVFLSTEKVLQMVQNPKQISNRGALNFPELKGLLSPFERYKLQHNMK